MNKADLEAIVSQVFSEAEISAYTNKVNPLIMTYAVESATGKVLEIKFYLSCKNRKVRSKNKGTDGAESTGKRGKCIVSDDRR